MALRPYGVQILAGSSSSVLASLYRQILEELGIKEAGFSNRLDRYIAREHRAGHITDPNSKRGNLFNELMQTTMTWTAFGSGLIILGVKHLKLSLIITTADNVSSLHEVEADLSIPKKEKADLSFETALERMFSKIRFDRAITPIEQSRLMNKYLTKNTAGSDIKSISGRRGGFTKELNNYKYTWKVLVKALSLFTVVKFTIIAQLTYHSGKMSTHGKEVTLEDDDD